MCDGAEQPKGTLSAHEWNNLGWVRDATALARAGGALCTCPICILGSALAAAEDRAG